MIRVERLSFAYPDGGFQPGSGSGPDDGLALSDISLTLPASSLCWLLGVNGSGKSTLLSLLAGLFEPLGGTIALADGSPAYPGESARKKGGQQGLRAAFVPQNPDTYLMGATVREDLLLSTDPIGDGAQEAVALATELGLAPLLDRPVHALSYGQKRKLCLASALASGPELLLLDEPFSGLDHPSALVVRQVLARNRERGLLQVITGHTLDMAGDMADLFVVLQAGRLVCQGDGAAVFPRLASHGIRPPCWWYTGGQGPLWLSPHSG